MNKIVNGVANDYEFPFLEKTTENYMQVIDGTGMYYEWYVKYLQQELQRKDNIINGIKKEVNEQLEEYEKGKEEYKKYGNLEDYAKGLRSAYISILDKIKELEKI